MMHFSCVLTCSRCRASLRFEDERPEWKTYDCRVEEAEECERSARFVAEHADDPLPPFGELSPLWIQHEVPEFVSRIAFQERTGLEIQVKERLSLEIPRPYRYVDCPVCDGHVKAP